VRRLLWARPEFGGQFLRGGLTAKLPDEPTLSHGDLADGLGHTVRKHTTRARTELTAQEASIARLARDGPTNTEIGAQLLLSFSARARSNGTSATCSRSSGSPHAASCAKRWRTTDKQTRKRIDRRTRGQRKSARRAGHSQ
jgi:hypothetical protein